MHSWQFKHFHKRLLVYNLRLQAIKVQLTPSIMPIEVQLLWLLVTIKKLCMILVQLFDLMINNPNIMLIEEIV